MQEITWNREISKQWKTTIYKVYFKLTLTFNIEIRIHTKREQNLCRGYAVF